jgi:hypothetical protein
MPPSQLQGGGRKAADLSYFSRAPGRFLQPAGFFPPKFQQQRPVIAGPALAGAPRD